MFAISYKHDGTKFFRVFEDLGQAQCEANKMACMGICEVTVYDYDADTKTFIEFYTV